MKSGYTVIGLAIIFGTLAGGAATFTILGLQNPYDEVGEFYSTENLVYVSPHHIRKAMDEGDDGFLLVDLRSREEYEREHIVGAINIPAYKDPNTSAYDEVERIVGAFSELPKDKEIIVYCYSIPCMTGRKIGKMLAEHGIYVKHLGVGWNEWRYFWTLWNHEHEWNATSVEDYVVAGSKPGSPKIRPNSTVCSIDGEFSC